MERRVEAGAGMGSAGAFVPVCATCILMQKC